MWNLSKMLSALWGIVGTLALITLFVVYTNFPEYFRLDFLGLNTEARWDRHGFFYVFTGMFLAVNLITFVGLRVANSLNSSYRISNAAQHVKVLVAIKILVVGANLFLITLMIYAKAAIEAQSLSVVLHWTILVVGPVIMISGLSYLLYVILFPVRTD